MMAGPRLPEQRYENEGRSLVTKTNGAVRRQRSGTRDQTGAFSLAFSLPSLTASRLQQFRKPSRPDCLTRDSGIPCCAVCFFAGINSSGYGGLHAVYRLLRAARPSLPCRCRTIQTLFHCAGDVLTCVLPRGRRKKQCKKRAHPNPNCKQRQRRESVHIKTPWEVVCFFVQESVAPSRQAIRS